MNTCRAILGMIAMTSILILGIAACEEKSCSFLLVIEEMSFEAALPTELDPATTVLELCIGPACDRARLATGSDGVVRCDDEDGRTETFPTECTFTASDRKIALRTNTVYGGHSGDDPLSLTAIAANGARTELLRGTVTFEDVTDDGARGACTEAWRGTFTRAAASP